MESNKNTNVRRERVRQRPIDYDLGMQHPPPGMRRTDYLRESREGRAAGCRSHSELQAYKSNSTGTDLDFAGAADASGESMAISHRELGTKRKTKRKLAARLSNDLESTDDESAVERRNVHPEPNLHQPSSSMSVFSSSFMSSEDEHVNIQPPIDPPIPSAVEEIDLMPSPDDIDLSTHDIRQEMGPDDSLLENFARNVDHDILVPSPESGTANVTPNEGLRQERKALLDKLKTLSLDGNLTSITVDEAKECFAVGYRMACMPHDCSDRAQQDILGFFDKNFLWIGELREKSGGHLPHIRTIVRKSLSVLKIPEIKMSFKWRDGAGTYHELTGLKTFPRKGIPPDWTLVMESAKVSINDTVQHHTESCPKGKPEKCVISIDGVSESKSGGSSAEIVSFSFQGCRHVYPVYMCRKSEKGQIVDYNILIGKHVLDMQSVGVAVEMVVADSVAVAKLLCMRSHAAFYSCRYCKREGNSFAQTQGRKKPSPLAARRQTKKVTWSYTPREFPLRTEERIAACAVYAMGNLRTQCKKKLAKGIMGRCMLLENANFDVTVGVPCEYMHLVYSGLFARTMQLIFDYGARYPGRIKKRVPLAMLNERLLRLKTPSDFSRRVRHVGMENNAEEHRVLCIFLFPVISDACKDFSKGAAEVIMLLGYGVRAYTIESYAEPSWGLTRNEVIQLLYRKYSHLFGDFNCTYNLHGLSHAEEMHVLGQAHRFSAFRFEKSYAPYKKTFKYANHTHLRRAIEKALLYNAMQHSCRKNVIYGRETTRTNDTCVYVQEALEVITYKIKEINGSDCTCERQVIEPFMYDIVSEDLKLDFGNVGIYKFVEASTDLVTIRMSNISGKYIEVEGFIVLVPMELIEETQ